MCSLIVLQGLTEAVLLFIDTYILRKFLKTGSKLMTQKTVFFFSFFIVDNIYIIISISTYHDVILAFSQLSKR